MKPHFKIVTKKDARFCCDEMSTDLGRKTLTSDWAFRWRTFLLFLRKTL